MISSNRNIFRITGSLYGEFPGHRWIPLTKANGGVNDGDASDWRRHRAHYGVTVMQNLKAQLRNEETNQKEMKSIF